MRAFCFRSNEIFGTLGVSSCLHAINITSRIWLASGKLTGWDLKNGPVEIVDLPINSMVIFHCYVNVYQRVALILVPLLLVVLCALLLLASLFYHCHYYYFLQLLLLFFVRNHPTSAVAPPGSSPAIAPPPSHRCIPWWISWAPWSVFLCCQSAPRPSSPRQRNDEGTLW